MKLFYSIVAILFAAIPSSFAQISEFSDEFNNACSLDEWQNVNIVEGWNASHLELHDIDDTNEGMLTMMPFTTAWYANYRSTLLFKEVSGDFVFTTKVTATNRDGDGIPSSGYSLAGCMIREARDTTGGWTPGQENYVFLSLGFAAGGSGPHFEVKNTINSNSTLHISPIDTASATIRLLRIGEAVIVLYELAGTTEYVVHRRYRRELMPDTVQMGMVSYTDWAKVNTYTPAFHNSHTINSLLDPDPSTQPGQDFNPDLIAKFDFARFTEATVPPEWVGVDFWDESAVSDSVILAIFAYPSVPTVPEGYNIWKGNNEFWTDSTNWSIGVVPTALDSIYIPNCSCTELESPSIPAGVYNYKSLIVEEGGELIINSGVEINIDLGSTEARFINDGVIESNGLLRLQNTQGKSLINTGQINCLSGDCIIIE